MRSSTLAIVVLALLLSTAVGVEALAGTASSAGPAAKAADVQAQAKKKPGGKAKRKRCRKGYVLRTVKVKRKGRTVRVKRCRKRPKAAPKAKRPTSPTAPTPTPSEPAPPPADDPARAFVTAKLADSRFTNCPNGWPTNCPVEARYSHFANRGFVYCRFSMGPGSPGLKDTVSSSYEIQNPRVAADGSWSFDSVVPNDGTYSWQVTAGGQVAGSFHGVGEDKATTLLTLQHVAGARGCSS